ncbi:hypothetical protein Bca4012_028114 [Brassica carinata]|uniref:Uncharacterized protein n=1 Tax=Brassica carinata TaxID=52824 RepID=A0A8X7VKW9_BRACI|nr:hypothetical protein Bca52824_025135 [Brassica carinata]
MSGEEEENAAELKIGDELIYVFSLQYVKHFSRYKNPDAQAYFKCAYDCFDRSRKQEEIANCVEHCSVPVVKSQQYFEELFQKLWLEVLSPLY